MIRCGSSDEWDLALLDGLLQQRQVALCACDDDGVMALMSPAMERLLGSMTDSAGHDEEGWRFGPCRDPLERALRGEPVVDELVSFPLPQRSLRWGLATAFRLQGRHGGRPLGAAVLVRDVTARIAERRRLHDLRDRLVETVNHEVRTPVATIAGHLELLEDSDDQVSATTRWSLGAIRRAAQRLQEVTATISELAELPQQPGGPRPSPD